MPFLLIDWLLNISNNLVITHLMPPTLEPRSLFSFSFSSFLGLLACSLVAAILGQYLLFRSQILIDRT